MLRFCQESEMVGSWTTIEILHDFLYSATARLVNGQNLEKFDSVCPFRPGSCIRAIGIAP